MGSPRPPSTREGNLEPSASGGCRDQFKLGRQLSVGQLSRGVEEISEAGHYEVWVGFWITWRMRGRQTPVQRVGLQIGYHESPHPSPDLNGCASELADTGLHARSMSSCSESARASLASSFRATRARAVMVAAKMPI
jgi:hypothetical protein